jgi:hypothetical protein
MEHRNREIRQAQEDRMVRDTVIMQKVNAANREAFRTRFPGQVEHCMRLTAERLQAVLTAKPADLTNPETWAATPHDIQCLAQALHLLGELQKQHPVESK